MDDCIFCKIIWHAGAASIVHEDDVSLAFMDTNPLAPGHLLVVPKQHCAYLSELKDEIGGHLFRVAMRLNRAVRASGLRCEGVNLLLADGEAAGQEVFHVHLHLFPRFSGDTFRVEADSPLYPSRAELDSTAKQIRQALNHEE